MKQANVYREAARLVEQEKERWACHAIARVLGVSPLDETKEVMEFEAMFRPANSGAAWMVDYPGAAEENSLADSQDRRILALCFMAAISESLHR